MLRALIMLGIYDLFPETSVPGGIYLMFFLGTLLEILANEYANSKGY